MKLNMCGTLVRKTLVVGALWAGALSLAQAAVVTYNFDEFADSDLVTNQIAGLTFANSAVLAAGFSLNDVEFPPASGANVLSDSTGPIEIIFSSPVFSVGALFTYAEALSFNIYDAADVLLGSVASVGSNNLRFSGSGASNELLSFSSLGGAISRLVITGGFGGSSFVMDDLTVDFGNASTVPEPITLALVAGLLGLGVLPGGWMRRVRRH